MTTIHDDDDNEYNEVLSMVAANEMPIRNGALNKISDYYRTAPWLRFRRTVTVATDGLPSALWPVFRDILGDEPKCIGAVYTAANAGYGVTPS